MKPNLGLALADVPTWASRDRPTTSPASAGRFQSHCPKVQDSSSAGCGCRAVLCQPAQLHWLKLQKLSLSLGAIPSFPTEQEGFGHLLSASKQADEEVRHTAGSLLSLLSPVTTGLSIKPDKCAVKVHPHMAVPQQGGLRHHCKATSAWEWVTLLPWALWLQSQKNTAEKMSCPYSFSIYPSQMQRWMLTKKEHPYVTMPLTSIREAPWMFFLAISSNTLC